MFHILLLNKQRAPQNNICSQSELTLPSAPPCQPGPLHTAPGAEGPPPPRWKPGCCGGQWDSVHHTGRGGQDVSTLLPGNGLIHLIRSKVRHWWIMRVEVEYKHDAVPFKIWPVNDPFKGADRAKVNKHETLGKRTWALSSASGHVSMRYSIFFFYPFPSFSGPLSQGKVHLAFLTCAVSQKLDGTTCTTQNPPAVTSQRAVISLSTE